MTNNLQANSVASEFTNEFIIDDQDEVSSPVPDTVSEPYGGIHQDFRQDTVFVLSIDADNKQPGTLTGEQCPMSDVMNNSYELLCSQYPHWRRMLADEYMRNTKLDKEPTTKTTAQLVLLHIDDHAWASVIHYLTGTKFLLQPDTYTKFCLDSGDPISQWTAAQVKLLSQKLPITKEHERDWHEQRKVDAWRRALLAKFAQNEDLQRALILTGWAKLVDRNGIPQHLLMWVRTVLRGDHQQQQQEEAQQEEEILLERGKRKREEEGVTEESKQMIMSSITKSKDDKNIEEVLRVIEGLFGKDRQQILSSILTGTPPTDQPRETVPKKPIEAKPVEMKDAVGYLEQIKNDEPPQTYHKFLEIMTDFRSEKINTPQVLERVTALFKGKPWLIRNFLMFLPPGHVLNLSPENKSNSIYITSPTGSKIIIHTDEGIITFE